MVPPEEARQSPAGGRPTIRTRRSPTTRGRRSPRPAPPGPGTSPPGSPGAAVCRRRTNRAPRAARLTGRTRTGRSEHATPVGVDRAVRSGVPARAGRRRARPAARSSRVSGRPTLPAWSPASHDRPSGRAPAERHRTNSTVLGRASCVSLANMGHPTLRRLGHSGLVRLRRPASAATTWAGRYRHRDPEGTQALIDAALDAGITLFDVADIYGTPHGRSEELLGAALGKRRADVVVATKFGMDMHGVDGPDFGARGSRWYVRRAVENSLRRLQTDWIDLYQLHQPDPLTPIDETLAALSELVAEGKVRYVGHSNFAGWQVADAAWRRPGRPPHPVHLRAERVLAAEPGPGGRVAAGRPGVRARRAAVLPAGQRSAVRQVHPGRRTPGQPAAGDQAAAAGHRPVGTPGAAAVVRRRARGAPCCRSRSAGCWPRSR